MFGLRGGLDVDFETLVVVAVGTAFLSITSATVAFMASPQNWWASALLAGVAVVMLAFVALSARDRMTYI